MALRSWLFVPADSENKLGMALGAGADAVVLDLADSVAPDLKLIARARAAQWLKAHRQQVAQHHKTSYWVRINPLDSRLWRDDLIEVMAGAPDGIVLPKSAGPDAVQQLAAELYEVEQRNQVANGATRIVPEVGGTATATIRIAAYADAPLPRLAGLTWNPPDLAAAIGAARRTQGAAWGAAFAHVRAEALLTAHARAVMAIDTFHPDYKDLGAFKAVAEAARGDGFTGMAAIHPAQVPAINAAFAPSEDELAEARSVVAVFEGNETASQIDRRMIERSAYEQARRVLGLSD